MIKHLALSGLLAVTLAGSAFAQATPPAEAPQQAPAAAPATPATELAPAAAPTPAPAPAEQAAAVPQSADECLSAAVQLVEAAEDKKLADEKLDKIDDLLTKMETHCDAKEYDQAMGVAKDIKSIIETQ